MICPSCRSRLRIAAYACPDCGISVQGQFMLPRLARLTTEQQHLAEHFILSGGNFKALAERLDISYPTLRKRVDTLVEALKALAENDNRSITALLDQVENGALPAEQAARLIREMNGDA